MTVAEQVAELLAPTAPELTAAEQAAEQAKLEALARLSDPTVRGPVQGPEHPKTKEVLYASRRLVNYDDFAEIIGRGGQSLRAHANRCRKRLARGEPRRASDLPEPAKTRYKWPRTESYWFEGDVRRWAVKNGKLREDDALTPIPYRPKQRRDDDD
jgi:hypothetical protein